MIASNPAKAGFSFGPLKSQGISNIPLFGLLFPFPLPERSRSKPFHPPRAVSPKINGKMLEKTL
jgi:hypothetical protein